MHTEMKYRFLIHYTLSFIGGYLGLYAIVSRADLFGNAQTANLLGVVRDLIGRDFCYCVWVRFSYIWLL